MKHFIYFTFFSSCALYAQTHVIPGSNYLAIYNGSTPKIQNDIEPESWSFDKENCRLWVQDNKEKKIRIFSGDGEEQIDENSSLLSDLVGQPFLTRSKDNKLEFRDHTGQVQNSLDQPWVKFSQRIVTGSDRFFSINYDKEGRRAWIGSFKDDGIETIVATLDAGFVIWPNYRLRFDATNKLLWLGFSGGAAGKPSTPLVQLHDAEGKLKKQFRWNDRGLFHDFCLNSDGSLLVSRDIPSDSGFTIPLFSFLENLKPDLSQVKAFAADQDDIMDGLSCEQENVFMARHSVWGSVGSDFVVWDRQAAHKPETLFKLPGPGTAVLSCND